MAVSGKWEALKKMKGPTTGAAVPSWNDSLIKMLPYRVHVLMRPVFLGYFSILFGFSVYIIWTIQLEGITVLPALNITNDGHKETNTLLWDKPHIFESCL